ncbi:trehalase family glycosidase [Chamaesiphon minutus]|uniref:Neutral trehalase n=1 Tax=Chamaesiphon minutus (strain ATCC 27169 / PCC 6605) TaxID=1173020 RepID=K9UIV8_CHAP6|nr:trehalase family glycosidase [Chamaesiphon minutus]AFY94139.1 neutral trehalase [Chamaesiphon minutus PCC 6605]
MLTNLPTTNPIPTPTQIQSVRDYIKRTWKTLYRSQEHILQAAKDIKVEHTSGQRWIVYVSQQEDFARVTQTLQQVLPPAEWNQIDLRILPADVDQIQEHGLLYLPHAYVVPGGRFNEMYGWDSYFIQMGLLRDGEIDLARSMTEQLVYEIEHYGTILNANRTYQLARSQPPLLTLMILAVYAQTHDRDWVRSLLPMVERFYYYWTVPPHLNPSTGLSRYYALGHGPAPEVLVSEKDEDGRTHYDRVREYYRQHEVNDYDLALYYDREEDCLTDLFYQGDRSMRESGFDISNRFGPFSVDIIHYVPVCLNVLLYQMEQDIATLYEIVEQSETAQTWRERAIDRHERIDRFLWDEDAGQYFDYNFSTGDRRPYEFATTFYPLWAGIASTEQAQRVVQNLDRFEMPGGLQTSTHISGNQWDAPFGWAPLQLFAVQGLRRYGYQEDAERLARKFIAMLVQEFTSTGTLVEKYDVCACSADVSAEILFGYSSNEVGFGWTNGVFLELLAILNDE